jgi:hypothetical protein
MGLSKFLKLKTTFTSRISQSLNTTMIFIFATVKDNFFDTFLNRSLGDGFPDS